MLKIWVVTALGLLAVLTGHGDNIKLLSFYSVNYSTSSPVINGRTDDSCWQTAEAYSQYYVYYKTSPEPGKLKTEMRMLWNERGLYLSVVNHDLQMSSIRTKYTTRDNPHLWKDDCAELYFDPSADSIGFTKFAINAVGAVADMRRIDAAISLPEWSASGIEISTSQDEDAWYIEAFFPWSDLGQTPDDGTIWRLCHVRYAWSSGKFVGVSSSPGGSYNSPEAFGFIYFSKNKTTNIKDVGKVLRSKATPPWSLPINNGLLVCDGGEPKFSKLSDLYSKHYSETEKLLQQIENMISDGSNVQFMELERRFSGLVSPSTSEIDMRKIKTVLKIADELDEFYWKQKIGNLLKDK